MKKIVVLCFIISTCMFAQQSDSLIAISKKLPKSVTDTTTLSFRDTDLRDIFRALSAQHGINIYVDNSINKRATVSLRRVRVYDVLKFICEQNQLSLELNGGIFKIMPLPLPPKAEPLPPKIPWVYYENNLLSVKLTL